jgi:glucose/arabinose dehydrogenase
VSNSMPPVPLRPLAVALLLLAAACGSGHPVMNAPSGSEPVVGVAFQPLLARSAAGQTIAHMALTGLLFLPDDRGLLVWEKPGRITHYRLEGDNLVGLGEMRLPEVYSSSDCGLMSVALDPDWPANHFVYASHCISDTHSAVTRFEWGGENYDAVPDTAARVIEVGDPEATKGWHNLGALGFFPDAERSLWVMSGEKTLERNAQDLSNDLGAVLRIVPRRGAGESGYDPHPDNPFAGPGANAASSGPDLYAWGLRNPWRAAIDERGVLFIGDVGNDFEEINVLREAGQNFAWGVTEGKCDRSKFDCKRFTDPVATWTKSSDHPYRIADKEAAPSTQRCAFVGVPYARAEQDPYTGFLDDSVLFADVCLGNVRALSVSSEGDRVLRDEHIGHMVGLTGAAQGPDGHLYVTSFGSCTSTTAGVGGGIFRVVPRFEAQAAVPDAGPTGAPLATEPLGPVPLKISETGLFSGARLTRPTERALPYEPSLPLWSNGSDKQRFLLLPEGGKVDNRERDAWDFPPGTLFVKTFSYPNAAGVEQRVETRIIRRTDDGYDYHVYRWQGDDADLLSLERTVRSEVKLEDGTTLSHVIPSGFDCRSCHESNRTVIIGFDELRLAGPAEADAPSQLERFAQIGLFAAAVPSDPVQVEHPDPETRELLGYLHGNCAHCHNASPNAMGGLSLEHPVALDNIISVPTEGSGQAAGIRVVPGFPDRSVLYQAFLGDSDDPELRPMPPIGVQLRDTATAERLRAWIAGLQP